MRYKCLIIEDNEIERDLIESYLLKINLFDIVACCQSGIDALEFLKHQTVDIVFSDIDMPDLSGLELLKNLTDAPVFVFTTSFPEYALDSINLDALDFLVKPLTLPRLIKSCEKARHYLQLKKNNPITAPTKKEPLAPRSYFFIKDLKGYVRINYNEVVYIESFGDFSKIHTIHKEHIALVNLKNVEKQISIPNFIRVHRQFMVNLHFVNKITGNEIELDHADKIPIGVAYREHIIEIVERKTLTRSTLQ